MSEFKITVKKFTSDTGGGSGNPLHLLTWNDESLGDFANYGGGRGNAIRKIWLTYLLLLDIKTQYALSSSFNPPPKDAVLEDGEEGSGTTTTTVASRKSGGDEEGDMKLLCKTVDGSVKELAKAMISVNAIEPAPAMTLEKKQRKLRNQDLEDLDNATSLQTKLEKQRKLLLNLPDA